MRVNDLVAKCAEGEVWPLRNQDELRRRWLAHDSAVYGPKATENAEER